MKSKSIYPIATYQPSRSVIDMNNACKNYEYSKYSAEHYEKLASIFLQIAFVFLCALGIAGGILFMIQINTAKAVFILSLSVTALIIWNIFLWMEIYHRMRMGSNKILEDIKK